MCGIVGLFLRDPADFTRQKRPKILLDTLNRLSGRHEAMLRSLTRTGGIDHKGGDA